ncbi:MAG: radical SAM protein [Desulfobacteraceae bacterium]|nr:radical SAM protein [Desulfobacteraceae bacterium]
MNFNATYQSLSSLRVNEIFFSIQGESLYAGRPCVFVRLAGCNLRCAYCDTKYAWSEGSRMEISQIIDAVKKYRFPMAEITGGEPLMQAGTPELARRLLDEKIEVLIETNGTYPIDTLPEGCIKIMDVKCPASGESSKTDFDNIGRLDRKDQVKFVVCDRNDYEYAKDVIRQLRGVHPAIPVLISPAAGMADAAEVAAWIIEDRLDARLHLQLHKIIWPGAAKGV